LDVARVMAAGELRSLGEQLYRCICMISTRRCAACRACGRSLKWKAERFTKALRLRS